MKPSNASELETVFAGLKVKMDQEISEKKSVAVLQEYYMNSLPQVQANFYSTLIEGRIHEEELQKYLDHYQISFKGSLFCCLVIYVSKTTIPNDMDERLLMPSVDKQAREQLEQRWGAKSFTYLDNTVMIVQLKDENELPELTDECDRFCKYIYRIIGAVVTIGVGQSCRSIRSP